MITKVLRVLAYFLLIGGFLCFCIVAGLYGRYLSQSLEIHSAVKTFVTEAATGSMDSLRPSLYPAFEPQMNELLLGFGDLFRNIRSVKDSSRHSYKWNQDTGEQSDYFGVVTFTDATQQQIKVRLVKYNGKWVVYGVFIAPSLDN